MVELSRTIRFCLNGPSPADDTPGKASAGSSFDTPKHNGYAGWPAMRGLGRYYEIHIVCRGQVDPVTGYFINIREIDHAVREHAMPIMAARIADDTASQQVPMGELLGELLEAIQPALHGSVVSLRLSLTPFLNLTLKSHDMSHVLVRQQFDFSAAHRLHVAELSDQENRDVFGKCNNPSGHGHNYRVEVALRVPIDNGHVIGAEQIDALVDRVVIEKLDHKHLNVDVPAFANLNPSVENIAKVIYGMLQPEVVTLSASLEEVSVWETEKTRCTYTGEPATV